jgi:hypothetical protein
MKNPHISFSELKEWVSCPWKHKLNYIEKIRIFKGNEFTAFGTSLHTVCEHLVENKDINAKKLFQEEFLKNLQSIKKDDPEIEFKSELINKMRIQGEKITEFVVPSLKKYFGTFELIKVEEQLYVPIEGEQYNFKGFIDLVIKDKEGKYHIIDWKTCSWGWDSRKRTDKMITYQLTLYKYFWCQKHDIDPMDVETHFALLKRTAKKDFVELFKVTSGKKKMQNAFKLLNKAIYNINKSNFIKNKLACYGRFGLCEYYKSEHCN